MPSIRDEVTASRPWSGRRSSSWSYSVCPIPSSFAKAVLASTTNGHRLVGISHCAGSSFGTKHQSPVTPIRGISFPGEVSENLSRSMVLSPKNYNPPKRFVLYRRFFQCLHSTLENSYLFYNSCLALTRSPKRNGANEHRAIQEAMSRHSCPGRSLRWLGNPKYPGDES